MAAIRATAAIQPTMPMSRGGFAGGLERISWTMDMGFAVRFDARIRAQKPHDFVDVLQTTAAMTNAPFCQMVKF